MTQQICIVCKFILYCINVVCWTATSDVHGFGGSSHSATTLIQCKEVCIKNSKCVAIDWEPTNAPNSCWILTLTFIGVTTQPGVITHYELNRACPSESYLYYMKSAVILLD